MQASAGETIAPVLTNAPQGLVGTLSVAFRALPSETVVVAASTAGITETELGDGTSNYLASIVIPTDTAAGTYEVVWLNGAVEVTEAWEVGAFPSVPVDTPYFTLAEARAVPPLSNATTYPDADITAMRVTVEQALEDACDVAFVPREASVLMDGSGTEELFLPHGRVSEVMAASVGGTALTADELADLIPYDTGLLYNPLGWTAGRGNVVLTYTHGYPSVPGRVKRAALLLLKRFLVDTPVNDRATSLQNDDGTVQYLVTAGVKSAIFDVPEANAVVEQYGEGASVA